MVSGQYNNYVNQIDLFVLALQHYAERKCCWWWRFPWLAASVFSRWFFYFAPHTPSGGCPAESAGYASQRIEHGQFDSPPLDTSLPMSLACLQKPLTRCRASYINLPFAGGVSRRKDPRSPRGQARLEVLYQCSQALNTSQIDVHVSAIFCRLFATMRLLNIWS